ncbi:hypothetical protein KCTC52924_02213 [Arenibacter antarcticus]|uniref:Ankyrin repeat domain-containing protein n=1 Tax=Arenibacter antarcticus TaxID=2040469 RepID=A0ABW5VGX8_9FLAO|nr:ankyrin repeat domain-containing protein [Arenibacter sp. H213]MCM4168634.1 ankyrin repeat domain-containing protein [Arenibacter sp. H213]
MRKTILIVAIGFLSMASGFSAEKLIDNNMAEKALFMKDARVLNSFCKAIVKGDIETVKRLIELGEDVNEKSLGKTPVIFAARYNKADILSLLLDNGADLTIRCDSGFTPKRHAELSHANEALAVINAYLSK